MVFKELCPKSSCMDIPVHVDPLLPPITGVIRELGNRLVRPIKVPIRQILTPEVSLSKGIQNEIVEVDNF